MKELYKDILVLWFIGISLMYSIFIMYLIITSLFSEPKGVIIINFRHFGELYFEVGLFVFHLIIVSAGAAISIKRFKVKGVEKN